MVEVIRTRLHTGVYSKVKVKVTLRLTVSQSVSLGVEPHLRLVTRYLLHFDSYGLVFLGRPLSREGGSVFCIYCWPLSAYSFSGPNHLRLLTISYCLRFETSLFVASYDSQGHGGGIRTRLHTGRYSKVKVKVKVTLRLAVYRQSICPGVKPLETHDHQNFFYPQLNPFDISPYVTSSLTRRWVCL
jgi:hypothetical protein